MQGQIPTQCYNIICITQHGLQVKQPNPIHPHALPAPLVHLLPMRQPTARHDSGWQSQVQHKLTRVFAYLVQYSLCGSSWSKVQYATKNWISRLTNYCMLSWRSSTNRDWTALLLAHVHQSSMAVYNWSTRSTVRRHQLYCTVGHDIGTHEKA